MSTVDVAVIISVVLVVLLFAVKPCIRLAARIWHEEKTKSLRNMLKSDEKEL